MKQYTTQYKTQYQMLHWVCTMEVCFDKKMLDWVWTNGVFFFIKQYMVNHDETAYETIKDSNLDRVWTVEVCFDNSQVNRRGCVMNIYFVKYLSWSYKANNSNRKYTMAMKQIYIRVQWSKKNTSAMKQKKYECNEAKKIRVQWSIKNTSAMKQIIHTYMSAMKQKWTGVQWSKKIQVQWSKSFIQPV